MQLWYMTFTMGMNVLVGAVYFSGNMIFLNSWTIWAIQWSKNKQANKKTTTNKQKKQKKQTHKKRAKSEWKFQN